VLSAQRIKKSLIAESAELSRTITHLPGGKAIKKAERRQKTENLCYKNTLYFLMSFVVQLVWEFTAHYNKLRAYIISQIIYICASCKIHLTLSAFNIIVCSNKE